MLRQPIWGWWGQRDQFAMAPEYDPVDGIERFQVGTPAILGVTAVLAGAELTAEAGIEAVAAKARALTSYAVELSDAWLAPLGFELASPRDPERRGAHVTLRHPRGVAGVPGPDRRGRDPRLPYPGPACGSVSPRSTRASWTCTGGWA